AAAPPPPAFSPPPPSPTFSPPPAAAPVSSGRERCGLCQGKGCVFCNQTGFKA
ncbi:MAG: hypothetical protein HQM02_03945, partial [Magnetococcales bacterium]|nr:hypothetical protein [Magnetococcales bacterium]